MNAAPPILRQPGKGFDAHRVAPKLWVGSYPGDGIELRSRARAAGFDRVVRVAADLPHEFPLHDDGETLTPVQAGIAIHAASTVAQELLKGKRVLVTCKAGINRSALVAGLAMVIAFRCTGLKAIAQLRAHRKVMDARGVLFNSAFARFLATYA